MFEEVLDEIEQEKQQKNLQQLTEEKPLERIDVVKMLINVFSKQQEKIGQKIFNKSEKILNEAEKTSYLSAYLLSSAVLDLYADIIKQDEMIKNKSTLEDLSNKQSLSDKEEMLKAALEYNEDYSVLINLMANQIYDDTISIAEETNRTDNKKIARSLARSLAKTIELTIARDFENKYNISIFRKNEKETLYTDVLKQKVEQIINESEK